MSTNPALLLIDLQEDFLAAAGLQPKRDVLVGRAAGLLALARAAQAPVIHIQTTVHPENDRRLPHWKTSGRWLCVAGSAGHKTPDQLAPLPHEPVVHKSGFNGFASGELDSFLAKFRCNTLILAGLHLHACVRTLATESLERRFNVLIAEEAVATDDPVLSAGTRRWLSARNVAFAPETHLRAVLENKSPSPSQHLSPRDNQRILFEFSRASPDEISGAARASQAAGNHWRQSDLQSRCAILERFASLLNQSAPELARQMAVDIGKPVAHATEEIRRATANVHDVISRANAFAFEQTERDGTVRHPPVGVIALITPWNNPVAIAAGKIAPALVYGNTILWKPAPAATTLSLSLMRLLAKAGLAPNTVQMLTGDHSTAQALAEHPTVDAVTLTGSAAAGHAIQEVCARRFLPLQAELSGNNAAIVWDDADFHKAAAEIARGAFGFAGQRCTANRRVIVHSAVLEPFLHQLKLAAECLVWGDPSEANTDIGPVINVSKAKEHQTIVQAARKSGAAHRVTWLFAARAQESWLNNGSYAQPVIVCCDQPEHRIVQEETMSPLLVVQAADNFERALDLCNGVRHGLVAALFSPSPTLQQSFLNHAQAGILKFNSSTAGAAVSLPFGGWKMSGSGPPEHGAADRLFYTRTQAVYGLPSRPA